MPWRDGSHKPGNARPPANGCHAYGARRLRVGSSEAPPVVGTAAYIQSRAKGVKQDFLRKIRGDFR